MEKKQVFEYLSSVIQKFGNQFAASIGVCCEV